MNKLYSPAISIRSRCEQILKQSYQRFPKIIKWKQMLHSCTRITPPRCRYSYPYVIHGQKSCGIIQSHRSTTKTTIM